MLPYSIAMQIRWEFCNSSLQNSSDKKLEADFTLLLEKNIFYSVLQGSTPTFDIEPNIPIYIVSELSPHDFLVAHFILRPCWAYAKGTLR
jgi:hypothetical protein